MVWDWRDGRGGADVMDVVALRRTGRKAGKGWVGENRVSQTEGRTNSTVDTQSFLPGVNPCEGLAFGSSRPS